MLAGNLSKVSLRCQGHASHQQPKPRSATDWPLRSASQGTTVRLRNVHRGCSCGTEINIVQEGIPELIPVEACYLGWQETLELPALLVQAEIK
jgi:hypothetical protein